MAAECCSSCERTSKRFDELLLSAATGNLRHSLKINLYGPKIKKIPKNTNARLAISALAGLLVWVLATRYSQGP